MRTVIMTLMGLFLATSTIAQERPMAEIFSEKEQEIHRQCGINFDGLKAAVANVLRRDGYQISHVEDRRAMMVSLTLNPTRIYGGCAVTFEVSFGFIGSALAPWGQRYALNHVICRKSSIHTDAVSHLQASLRSHAIEFTEFCLYDEERFRIK